MEPLLVLRPRARQRGRDRRVAAAGVRRLHRDARLLSAVARDTDSTGGTSGSSLDPMLRVLLGLLVVIAIVLVLVKAAVFGGLIGAIALLLLIFLAMGSGRSQSG